MAQLDQDYKPGSGAVNKYRRPLQGRGGRWPDVSFEIDGLGRFVVEVQLAPISAQDIAGRSRFYEELGFRLIWVVPWSDLGLTVSARQADIEYSGSGTWFVLDPACEEEARSRGQLLLRAVWREDDVVREKLVGLRDLNWASTGHPFVADTVSRRLFAAAEIRRQRVVSVLRESGTNYSYWPVTPPGEDVSLEGDSLALVEFLATLFSSAKSTWCNYHNGHENERGLLHSFLDSRFGQARASVVRRFVDRTAVKLKLNRTTLQKFEQALRTPQLEDSDESISFALGLFPEVYRDDLRERALVSGELPDWAISA